MLRAGLVLLGLALVGVLMFATGAATFGPCGPDGAGYLAALMVLAGGPLGLYLTCAGGIQWLSQRNLPQHAEESKGSSDPFHSPTLKLFN